MEQRQLGQSDLQVPVVGFGAWAIGGWMWGGTDDEAAIKAIQKGIDEGITLIDTAPSYGMGHSERIVGKAIEGRRDEVIIATKCGIRWDLDTGTEWFRTTDNEGVPRSMVRCLSKDSIKHEVEQSLERLNIEVIDLYQCHWPDPDTPIAETMEALLAIQQEGKVRAIGVSNFSVEQMQECLRHGVIASDQPEYNPLERGIEHDVLPFCIEQNIGVLAYSPIAQGLMTGKVTMDREFPEGDVRRSRPWFQPDNRKRVLDILAVLQPIADGHKATLAQLTIAWVLAQPGITSALVGARNENQVVENARAARIELSDDEIQLMREAVESLGVPV
jgi:methylglyoxal reductase